jgi:hypothetical protein
LIELAVPALQDAAQLRFAGSNGQSPGFVLPESRAVEPQAREAEFVKRMQRSIGKRAPVGEGDLIESGSACAPEFTD